jgi:hypothetical protein
MRKTTIAERVGDEVEATALGDRERSTIGARVRDAPLAAAIRGWRIAKEMDSHKNRCRRHARDGRPLGRTKTAVRRLRSCVSGTRPTGSR